MDIKTAIYHYCDYQERCHKEVRSKLYELGAKTPEVEDLIATLIEADLLNEERYAKAIARGKFRLMQWGRIKIVGQLKANRISEYCIKKALKEIDDEEYIAVLTKLATRKWQQLKERNIGIKKNKVLRYLLQKGYESNLALQIINDELMSTE